MKTSWTAMALVVSLALVAACTDEAKAPAEAAMAAASAAMDSLKGDAAKYAPDAVKSLESSYSVARDSMVNKDYKGALTFARDIPAKAKDVLAKAAAAKDALARAWGEASDGMRRTIQAAKSRLHTLSQGKKLPAGIDKATLAKADADLSSLEKSWSDAAEQYKAGDLSGAVAKAKELNAQGIALLKAIGLE